MLKIQQDSLHGFKSRIFWKNFYGESNETVNPLSGRGRFTDGFHGHHTTVIYDGYEDSKIEVPLSSSPDFSGPTSAAHIHGEIGQLKVAGPA